MRTWARKLAPEPPFYYDIGGGPMLDMGPYCNTALINILGPVKRVAGVTARTFEERVGTAGLRTQNPGQN